MKLFFLQFLVLALQFGAMAAVGFFGGSAAARLLPAETGRLKQLAPYLLFASSAQLPSWIGDENTLILFPIFLWVFLACYKGPIIGKLVGCAIFYLLNIPFNMILDTVERFNSWDAGSALTLLGKAGFTTLIYLLVRKLTHGENTPELSTRLWSLCGLLGLSPLIATLSFAIWNGFGHTTIDGRQLRLAYTILPFATLSAAALLIAVIVLSRHEELERSAQMAQLRTLYYEGLQSQELQVRTLRHDLRNHLAALQGLLEAGEHERAKAYLQELSASPALHGIRRICENETANVVLSSKLEQMEAAGVEADILATLPRDLRIADSDLCALLGNALDNALESARSAGDKTVTVRIRADRGILMLRVKNACVHQMEHSGGAFQTTKERRDEHGFGLRSMRAVAEQYGGTLDASVQNGYFELVVCLPLGAPAQAEHGGEAAQ